MNTADRWPPMSLPTDRPRRAGLPVWCSSTATVARVRFGAASDDVLLAGFAAVLYRYTGQERVTVDTENGPVRYVVAGGSPLAALTGMPAPGAADGYGIVLDVRADDVDLHYDAELFDAATAERLLEHFVTLVVDATRSPDRPVARLRLLPDDEARRMLVDWNQTRTVLSHGTCLHEAFAAQAARRPDAAAVVSGSRRWTFAQIDAAANRLAHHLRHLGVGPDVRAGVCLDRSADLLVAVLGVMKAGGAYVPLDPRYPAQRLAAMVDGASCAVMVSRAGMSGNLPATGTPLVLLDRDAAALDGQPAHAPAATAGPDDLCYVIHTSGSTGSPKPIALRHRGVLNNIADLNSRFGVGPGDSVLALSSPSFDMSVYEFLGVTGAGGTVVVPDPARADDPAHWAELLTGERVTIWNTAPALLGLLVDHLDKTGDRPRLPALRLALLGGDWVPVTLPDRLRAIAPRLRFIVMGGATEASIHSTIYEVETTDPGWASIPYGRPMANQRVYILDDHRQPVPPGVPGELYLAGTGLARGYLGRPEWTAERFIEWSHPWSGGSERLYRTGDRARFGADGLIELLGRADFQIKINGLRIEPGEIEAVLRDHPAVRKVVVSARDGRLIAHVVPVPGTALDGTALDGLRDHALTRLPEYQVPAAFVPLDDLPLTPNGKVDRRALPDPDLAGSAYRAPRSAVEKVLADAWTQVLGITRVGIDDDFIAIGGDSIRAAQAVTRARAAGVGVTARQILQLRTIATIAPSAGSVAPTGVPAPGPLVGVGADEMAALNRRYPRLAEVWPLTPMQSGMLFESLVNENTYLLQVVYHLSGPVDPGRLRAAARALPDRHAALRAGFVIDVAEEPVQVVLDRVDPPWREVDLSDVSDGAQEKAFERFLADDRSRRVDPDAPPLLRFSLVTLGAQRARLVLTAHHLLIDGWSEQVLAGDLLRLYAGGPAEPARPFRDFLVWSARQDPGRAAAAWAAELAGLDAPTVLAPAPAGGSAGGSAGIVEVAVPLQTGGFGRAAELGVTANTVAQAAWAIVLAALTGRQDVVFGATTAGRPGELTDAGSMVGLFINTVPVRVLVDPRRSVKDLVTDLQNRQAGLLEHQHLGLTEIHRVVGVDRLFDTMVAFQSFPTHRSTGGDVEITGIDSVGVGSYPMSLLVEGDRLTVQYDRSVFDHDVVTTIAGCYRSVVRQLVSGDPDRCVDMIDGLPRTMATGRSAAAAVGAVGAYRAGRTAREVALCEAFADVLGIDRVGIDDDFFALGCNSLKATRIIGRIRRTLGIEVSISSIFQYSTVARLSGRLPTTPARPGLRRMVPDISVRSENGDD